MTEVLLITTVVPPVANMLAISPCISAVTAAELVGSSSEPCPPWVKRTTPRMLAATRLWRDVKIFDAGLDGMAVMFAARGCTALIVVDTNKSGSRPGVIFEVPGDELAHPHQASLNLHDFRWDHALHMGRQIFKDDFPRDVSVILVEAGSLDLGLELTPPVAAALDPVIARVVARIEAFAAARASAHVQ